jgi:hypothetical protein
VRCVTPARFAKAFWRWHRSCSYAYDRAKSGRTNWGEIVKKRNVLVVAAAMLFVAAAFAGGIAGNGSDERAHYSDAEYSGPQVAAVMRPDYKVPPSNQGE